VAGLAGIRGGQWPRRAGSHGGGGVADAQVLDVGLEHLGEHLSHSRGRRGSGKASSDS